MSDAAVREDAPVLEIDPFSTESLLDPLPIDTLIRETAELVWIPAHGVWFTGRHDVIDQVFRDYETFESSAGTGLTNTKRTENWRKPSVILENDPPSHGTYRRVMTSVLSPRVVRRVTEEFQQRADELVDRVLADGPEIDLAPQLAVAYPLQVLPDALGIDPEGRQHLLPYSNLNFQAQGPRNEHFHRAQAAAEEAATWVNWQMRRESLRPGGLGQTIYEFADEATISHDDAAMLVRTFLSAGVDTTIFGIQHTFLALISQPDAWAALHDDPSLARRAFEEGLRWNAPSPFIARTTSRPCVLGGVALQEGEKVVMDLAAANRDPRRWENPDVYDLERDATGHLAFGTGIHGCVGQMMARMEATCLLSALARRVRTIAPAGEPVRIVNNWLRGFESLPARVEVV
ncbi:MAG: cytochrome P450 [Actinobacteria bacterium]|nr:cytochrome P450 [Actinomycetota bacterium]